MTARLVHIIDRRLEHTVSFLGGLLLQCLQGHGVLKLDEGGRDFCVRAWDGFVLGRGSASSGQGGLPIDLDHSLTRRCGCRLLEMDVWFFFCGRLLGRDAGRRRCGDRLLGWDAWFVVRTTSLAMGRGRTSGRHSRLLGRWFFILFRATYRLAVGRGWKMICPAARGGSS